MEQHTPIELKERAPLQQKINYLTTELAKYKKVNAEIREVLKSVEQENIKLKETLEGVVNTKKETPFRKFMADLVEVVENIKFQSPIVRKES